MSGKILAGSTSSLSSEQIEAANVKSGAVTPAKLGPITWKAVSATNAKFEGAAGFETPTSAVIGDGLAALRGALKVKAGETIAAGEKLFTVNAETKPSKERLLSLPVLKKAKEGKGVIVGSMNTAGEVFAEQAIAEAEVVSYDGMIYSL
jgi:hypothetical protein